MFLREHCGKCMILNSARTWRGRARQRGGLGLVSTSVGRTPTLVFSSSPITAPRSVGPARPVIGWRTPVSTPIAPSPTGPAYPVSGGWQQFGPGGVGPQGWQSGRNGGSWNAQSNPYGSTPQNPNNSQALAAAQALLATNPSLLTSQQFQMLQQAGLVSNTLPYSSVSNINPTTPLTGSAAASANDPNCVAAGCTGGPYPNCTCAAAAAPASDIGTTLSQSIGGLPLYLWLVIAGGGFLLLSKRGR